MVILDFTHLSLGIIRLAIQSLLFSREKKALEVCQVIKSQKGEVFPYNRILGIVNLGQPLLKRGTLFKQRKCSVKGSMWFFSGSCSGFFRVGDLEYGSRVPAMALGRSHVSALHDGRLNHLDDTYLGASLIMKELDSGWPAAVPGLPSLCPRPKIPPCVPESVLKLGTIQLIRIYFSQLQSQLSFVSLKLHPRPFDWSFECSQSLQSHIYNLSVYFHRWLNSCICMGFIGVVSEGKCVLECFLGTIIIPQFYLCHWTFSGAASSPHGKPTHHPSKGAWGGGQKTWFPLRLLDRKGKVSAETGAELSEAHKFSFKAGETHSSLCSATV